MVEVLREGVCRCHREPRNGECGLEGYNRGEAYHYQLCRNKTGRYMRIWHSDDYYETCGPVEFLRFFEPEGGPCPDTSESA